MRFLIIGFLFLSACATRTKYQPQGESGGYSEARVDSNVMVARFSGNAYTHKNDAQIFSQFRAIEICREQGYKVARPMGQEDKTSSKTVQKTSNYTYQNPTYFNGTANTNTNYNYYGGNTLYSNSNTNVNGTITGGDTYGGSQTWNETYVFPTIDTYFSCANEINLAGLEMKVLTPEEVKDLAKDKLGGVQVMKHGDDSPNKDIFQVGDIVLKVDNKRVLTVLDFGKMINESKDKNAIPASIVREGVPKNIKFKAVDKTSDFEEMNNQVVRTACTVQEVKSRPICQQVRGLSSTGK